jgi:hypothetical protein
VTDTKISPFHAVVTHGVKAILAASTGTSHHHRRIITTVAACDAEKSTLLLPFTSSRISLSLKKIYRRHADN